MNETAARRRKAETKFELPLQALPQTIAPVFRRDLIPLLLDNSMSLSQIARAVGESPKDVSQALSHLSKSLKHTDYEFVVEPAECRRCGFEFGPDKLNRPSKCPNCKGTWIAEPFFLVKTRPPKNPSGS